MKILWTYSRALQFSDIQGDNLEKFKRVKGDSLDHSTYSNKKKEDHST